jgi:hypothetical protein
MECVNREIIDFYSNLSYNGMPTLDDVLNADTQWLEDNHNWVQRAFPNYEPSEAVPNSPILDDDTLDYIKANHMADVHKLVHKYMYHYQKLELYQVPHNNRRVTRLLKFLILLQNIELAYVAYMYYHPLYTLRRPFNIVDRVTYKFWNDALNYKKQENNND